MVKEVEAEEVLREKRKQESNAVQEENFVEEHMDWPPANLVENRGWPYARAIEKGCYQKPVQDFCRESEAKEQVGLTPSSMSSQVTFSDTFRDFQHI